MIREGQRNITHGRLSGYQIHFLYYLDTIMEIEYPVKGRKKVDKDDERDKDDKVYKDNKYDNVDNSSIHLYEHFYE